MHDFSFVVFKYFRTVRPTLKIFQFSQTRPTGVTGRTLLFIILSNKIAKLDKGDEENLTFYNTVKQDSQTR